jgi:cell division septation protein DedD
MHLEMTNKICALCKRLVAANGHPDRTRLCEECRSLIQTILPKPGSNSLIEIEPAKPVAHAQLAMEGTLHSAFAAPVSFEEDLGDVESVSPSGHFDLTSFDPVADFDEVQASHISRIETDYLDEFEASEEEAYMPAEASLDLIDEETSQLIEPAAQDPEIFLMPVQEEDVHNDAVAYDAATSASVTSDSVTYEAAPSEEPDHLNLSRDEESRRIISLPYAAETKTRADLKVQPSMSMEAAKVSEAISDTEETSYQEAIDPWDDPLPAWEQSRNEYPLYVGIAERKRRSRFKALLAPAVVIVCVVAAYLLFQLLQSKDSAPENQQAVETPAQGNLGSSLPVATPQALDSTKPASDEAQQVASTSSDASASSNASDAPPAAADENKEAPLAAATTDDGAAVQWRHSLQALASPSADEANTFAERLRSAGIPAYVISADIANRGRWFRVRVGGFSTAQEAQKFAAEARAHAKAAGVTLKDLNVVEYVKP